MWGQIAAAAGQGALGFFSGLSQRGTVKRAGTIIQQQAEDEESRAMERAQEINPRLQEAYLRAQQGIESTAFPQADVVQQRGERGGAEAVGYAREANALLDPYMGAGATAATSLSELAGPQKKFTAADLEMDPSYQFRLTEGQKALERSRAAKGVLAGGGTAKALTRYAQGAASTEYAAAFDRFMKQQDQRSKTLMDIANLGGRASERAGLNLTGAGEFAGELGLKGTTTGAGMRARASELVGNLGVESTGVQAQNVLNADVYGRGYRDQATQARANSMIGGSNAFWGGLQGAVGGAAEGLSLWDTLRRPRGGGGPLRPGDYGN